MPSHSEPGVAVRRRRGFVGLVGVLLVVVLGVLLFGPKTSERPRTAPPSDPSASPQDPTAAATSMPPAYLAWMSGGFPPDFRTRVGSLSQLRRTVVVAGDTVWMTGSHDADGKVVDAPTPPFAVPIDAFAVTPAKYGPFLPSDIRDRMMGALDAGKAVLGQASAGLRQIGVGGSMTFGGHNVTVGAVVPDAAVGWAEMLVSREVGATLGITDDRYLLAEIEGAPSEETFGGWVGGLLPGGTPLRVVAPGGSRYMRVGSGVNPPVVLKQAFGEFTAHPQADPAFLTEDPSWVRAHIQSRTVPLLGSITCNRLLFPPLIAALEEVQQAGLGNLIHTNSGCWSARTVARSPTAPPSDHAYGAAVDINAPENAYGARPTMDRRIVRIFQAHGFTWGGAFLIPDGMHFEYGQPDPTTGSTTPSATAISTQVVTAGWTRAIEAAIGGREVSVAIGAGDKILFEHAGAKPRIPASNQKLLTSMAALSVFGADHRFPTVAATRRPLKGGVIRGDLWLVGSGDPELNASSMSHLADAVRAAGVTRITGGVIGDTSAFTREWWAPGWVPGLSRSYVTRTTALAFDGNAGSGLPEEAAAAALTSALRAHGVAVAREPSTGEAPPGLEPVAVTRSRPLRDLLSVQNHGSVNFYAETLLKAIGAKGGAIGSTASGADAVTSWVSLDGVTAQVMDGSGLSHRDLISAHGLETLLLLAQDQPWGQVLDASLAPSGEGTLQGRLVGIPVRAKTGTLFETPVSSLSGYVTDAGGTRVAFSVISRGLDKSSAIAIEDAIVRTLARARIG